MTGRQRRWRRRGFQGAVALTLLGRALILDAPIPSNAAPGDLQGITERVSLDYLGRPTPLRGEGVNYESFEPSVSADGRFVAFTTEARLVPIDKGGDDDVYVRDRLTDEIRLVSISCVEDEGPIFLGPAAVTCRSGNDDSYNPQISADGLKVAFESEADDLVIDPLGEFLDETFDEDIYLADYTPTAPDPEDPDDPFADVPVMTLVSVHAVGRCPPPPGPFDAELVLDPCPEGLVFADEQFNGRAEDPTMSADGTQIAFTVPDGECGGGVDSVDGVGVEVVGDPCIEHATGVWIRNLDVNESVHIGTVFDDPEDATPTVYFNSSEPSFASDGRYLTFIDTLGIGESFDLVWLYDRDGDGDGIYDEPNPNPPGFPCDSVCAAIANRHPDVPFPRADVDEDGDDDYAPGAHLISLFDTSSSEPVVALADHDTPDPADDEIVVAYEFTDFDFETFATGVGATTVPAFMQIVVVTTFDRDLIGDLQSVDPEVLIDPTTSTVVASLTPDPGCATVVPALDECYGDGFGSGVPAVSADGRYLAFVVSDGALITLDEGQVIPPEGSPCFAFGDSIEGAQGFGAASVATPCQVVLYDVVHPENGLRAVSLGGDPRDPADPEASVAVEPTQLGTVIDSENFDDGDSFAPSLSADGRVIAFESEADNLLGSEPGYYYPEDLVPFDSNGASDVYVRELSALLSAAPNPLAFGANLVGTLETQSVTLTNTGLGPVSIPETAAFSITSTSPVTAAGPAATDVSAEATDVAGSNDFSLSVDGCAGVTIHAGETCGIQIAFRPSGPGLKTAFLTMTIPVTA